MRAASCAGDRDHELALGGAARRTCRVRVRVRARVRVRVRVRVSAARELRV